MVDQQHEFGLAACESFLCSVLEEGYSVVVEIGRLADLLPHYFSDPSKSKYKNILFDFNYFLTMENCEKTFDENQYLAEELLSENRMLLANFSRLFGSLTCLVSTFKQYVEESSQHRLYVASSVKELEMEIIYVLGVICLQLENRLTPLARERLIVLLYILSDDSSMGLQFVLDFLHAPQHDEDTLFNRIGFPSTYVEEIAQQAVDSVHEGVSSRVRLLLPQLLYVCFRFSPPNWDGVRLLRVLELFFADQWVLCVGDVIVNLLDEWASHRGLSHVLSSRITTTRARTIAEQHIHVLNSLELPQGPIDLCDVQSLFPLVGKANASLEWLCLHSYDRAEKKALPLLAVVKEALKHTAPIYITMANIAKFESKLFSLYEKSLRQRKELEGELVREAATAIEDITQLLSSSHLNIKQTRRQKLIEWLGTVRQRVGEDIHVADEVRRRVDHVMASLGVSSVVGPALESVRASLGRLSSLCQLSPSHLHRLRASSCAPYGFDMLVSWRESLQLMLVESPLPLRALVSKMFSTVMSMSRCVSAPFRRRLFRALSSRLSRRLSLILQYLPVQVFAIIDSSIIPHIQYQWPISIEKTELRGRVEVGDRMGLSDAVRSLSNVTLGVWTLCHSSLRSREFLERGIRDTLRERIRNMLTPHGNNVHECIRLASRQARQLRGAVVFACEQLALPGFAIWREEVRNAVDQLTKPVLQSLAKGSGWSDPSNRSLIRLLVDTCEGGVFEPWEQIWTAKGKPVLSPSVLPSLEACLPSVSFFFARVLLARVSLGVRQFAASRVAPDASLRALSPLASNVCSMSQGVWLAQLLFHGASRTCRLLSPCVWNVLRVSVGVDGASVLPLLSTRRGCGALLVEYPPMNSDAFVSLCLLICQFHCPTVLLSLFPVSSDSLSSLRQTFDSMNKKKVTVDPSLAMSAIQQYMC